MVFGVVRELGVKKCDGIFNNLYLFINSEIFNLIIFINMKIVLFYILYCKFFENKIGVKWFVLK